MRWFSPSPAVTWSKICRKAKLFTPPLSNQWCSNAVNVSSSWTRRTRSRWDQGNTIKPRFFISSEYSALCLQRGNRKPWITTFIWSLVWKVKKKKIEITGQWTVATVIAWSMDVSGNSLQQLGNMIVKLWGWGGALKIDKDLESISSKCLMVPVSINV